MNKKPMKNDDNLRKKLDEYHVSIPDFPMKPSKWERLINFLASPAKNPFEPLTSTWNGIFALKYVPLMGAAVLTSIQLLIII